MKKIKLSILALVALLSISFTSTKEIEVSTEEPEYSFNVLAESENGYIKLFEVDGQKFVYIYEGSLQKLD